MMYHSDKKCRADFQRSLRVGEAFIHTVVRFKMKSCKLQVIESCQSHKWMWRALVEILAT
jgi:hypothetical protein